MNIEPARRAPNAMYLRQVIATGEDENGTTIELALAGATLVMTVQHPTADSDPYGTGRTVETISLGGLAQVWAATITGSEVPLQEGQ